MKKVVIFLISLLYIINYYRFDNKSFLLAQEQKDNKKKVYCIVLEGAIMEGLARSIQNKLVKIPRKETKAVVIEIHTPGGIVTLVKDICREIDDLHQAGIPVYAYVTGHAWSGGAMVALACDKIYMKPQSSIGSAEPKAFTPWGVQDVGEKELSALRAEFRALAQTRGYPTALAEAMVDKKMDVREIFYRGEPMYVTLEELNDMRAGNNPKIDDPSKIIEGQNIVPAGKLANFTAEEAKRYGICREIYGTREKLLKGIALDEYELVVSTSSVSEGVSNFLTNNWVRMILLAMGILLIFIELVTPGFGVIGISGILCMILYFLGGYFAEVTEVWEILVFFLGLVLIIVEVFFLPGFGIVGILGIILCFIGLVLSLQTFIWPRTPEESATLMNNIFYITIAIGVDIIGIFFLMRFLPVSPTLRRLTVPTVQKVEDGYSAAILGYEKLLGKEGIANSTLRPAGKAQIEGEIYDVMAQGDFINPGQKIKVIDTKGNRIVVEKIEG